VREQFVECCHCIAMVEYPDIDVGATGCKPFQNIAQELHLPDGGEIKTDRLAHAVRNRPQYSPPR